MSETRATYAVNRAEPKPAEKLAPVFTPDQLAEIAAAIQLINEHGGGGEITIGFRKKQVSYINTEVWRGFNTCKGGVFE